MNHGLDDIAPAFRAACDRWPHAPNLQQHYRDLACTYEENGSSLIELIKSFLEAVCWTVIQELDGERPGTSTPSTHQVLRCALDALGLSTQRGIGPYDDLLSGLNKLTKSIDDLRRNHGSVAHGKDAFIDSVSADVLRPYLAATDAIISIILRAFDGTEPELATTREPVTRYEHLNRRINATTLVNAELDEETGKLLVFLHNQALEAPIEIQLTPAEVLYELFRDAYIEVLEAINSLELGPEPILEEDKELPEEIGEEEPAAAIEPQPEPSRLQLLDDYQGRYQGKVTPFYEYVIHNLLGGDVRQAEQVLRFVNTVMAEMENLAVVDWTKRPPVRSRVKVFLKRIILAASIEGLTADAIPPLLEWLSREIEGGSNHV